MGSNSAQDIDVCPRIFVLYCLVEVETFRRADSPSKESYQCQNDTKIKKEILIQKKAKVIIRTTELEEEECSAFLELLGVPVLGGTSCQLPTRLGLLFPTCGSRIP